MAGEELRRLCSGGGWTYGALWCSDCRNPRLLVLEESYHEEQSGNIFEKVVNQVHVIGQGTIGEVAITGKHRWINFDTICMESSEISSSVNPEILQDSAEWEDQIMAGIKTIAVIPLPSSGVLQFGSIQKIGESPDFIAQAQHLLWQFRIKQHGCLHVDMNFSHPQATFDSAIASLDYSMFKNNVFSYDSIYKQRQDNNLSSECSSLASGLLSLGSQTSSLKLHAFSKPIFTSSGPFNGQGNLFYGTPSFSGTSYQVIDQQEASTKAQTLLPPNKQAKDIDSSSYMAIPGVFNMIPTTLNSSIPQSEAFHFLSKKSDQVGSKPVVNSSMSFNNSEPSLSVAGKLLELQHCSSLPVSVCDISTSKSSSKVFPFTPDLPESFLTYPQDQNPENSTLICSNTQSINNQIHNSFMNNPIHSCDQTNHKLNSSLSARSMYSFPDIPTTSSSMAAALPITATESSAVCIAPSLDGGCHRNLSTVEAHNQHISDNDLFDSMELDLSPMVLRQECWDGMLLPVVGNGCAGFSTGISDCTSELEIGSIAGSGKGFFSDSSSYEQLLDAVVIGNANLSTGCNSVSTMNSVIFQDSIRHISTNIKHGDVQIPAEKTMRGLLSDEQPNSHIHTWIDDSCSVNAECSTLYQPNKLVESTKVVRKRARPGESTRPRPKDRQQIQDRVKELREIVPNGAKCSIDSLLDRTIKHMLFLQSVTKYVDKLKQTDEPKLIGEESGVVLKDNTNGGVGGATWAYEAARQTMVCPILVEDVHPSGQMLVEMLCEERGFFLEIADIVRGFGLTILKGDMEIRERKVWARFLVEANRDVTRMDIFLSLVQFLQQTSSFQATELYTRAVSTGINSFTACQQKSPAPIPIGLADKRH